VSNTQRPPCSGQRPAALRVEHLSHRYGRQLALQDLNFEVQQGEIFGFIGPNGAGKTTTMRAISTLLAPLDGVIEVYGINIAEQPEQARALIGYMPDHAGVYPRLTVREYLSFFARAFYVQRPGVTAATLELTGLHSLQNQMVSNLSKGYLQRLQLARVLLHDPSLLVLDEPASDLDPRARIEIRDLLLELKELGKTILLSSHILTELSDVCSSVGIMEHGRLIEWGPLGEISRRLSSEPTPGGATLAGQASAPSPDVSQVAKDSAGKLAMTAGGAEVPASAIRTVRIRVLPGSIEARSLIEASTAVLEVRDAGANQYLIRYAGDDAFIASLVHHLVSHGVHLVAVEPQRHELERVFLELTGKGSRD
jgi:ABC-2 type transport system ATP-binding protein